MNKILLIALSIALTAVVTTTAVLPSILTRQSVEQIPSVGIHDFLKRVDNNIYVVIKPPSWAELYDMASRGIANYRYIDPGMDILTMVHGNLMAAFVYNTSSPNPCNDIKVTIGEIIPGNLLDNDCQLLRKVAFGTEREPITVLGLVDSLAYEQVSKEGMRNIIAVFYKKNASYMELGIFNIANDTEYGKLYGYLNNIITENRIVVFVMHDAIRSSIWYYDVYRYLEDSGVPYVVYLWLYDMNTITPRADPIAFIVDGYMISAILVIQGGSYGFVHTLVFKNGSLDAVATDYTDMICPRLRPFIACTSDEREILRTHLQ